MKQRTICLVTGCRADYGLLRPLIKEINSRSGMVLRVVATGAHLAAEYGDTLAFLHDDGVLPHHRIPLPLDDDSPTGIAGAVAQGVTGFSAYFAANPPDVIVVLGDRFEAIAVALAAVFARLPIAHIHGGELTVGAVDDALRHSITKMSHLHFTAAQAYRRRVIQLGEQPGRVYNVGALAVDALAGVGRLERAEISSRIGFEFCRRNLLVTYHPETLSETSAAGQFAELLAALRNLDDTGIVFTLPNPDLSGHEIREMALDFVSQNPGRRVARAALGSELYVSVLSQMDAVVGNSSSGIIEAPILGIPTLNIGDRQAGRIRTASIIDCAAERSAIAQGIAHLYDAGFREGIADSTTPYGAGGAAKAIASVLESYDFSKLRNKVFFDLASHE